MNAQVGVYVYTCISIIIKEWMGEMDEPVGERTQILCVPFIETLITYIINLLYTITIIHIQFTYKL